MPLCLENFQSSPTTRLPHASLPAVPHVTTECYDYPMPDTAEQRCPNCESTDLVVIHTKAITDELLECRSCMKLYRLEYEATGATRLVAV
jgi:hypothetical protein